ASPDFRAIATRKKRSNDDEEEQRWTNDCGKTASSQDSGGARSHQEPQSWPKDHENVVALHCPLGCAAREDWQPLATYFVAGSQCSAILPSTMRNMSNHVVVYFFDESLGSGYSRTKNIDTRSPSASIATSGAFTRGSMGAGFLTLEKKSMKAWRPVGTRGLCWM